MRQLVVIQRKCVLKMYSSYNTRSKSDMYSLQSLLGLVNQPLNLKPCISRCELLQQLPSPDTLLTLNVELLHAHEQPSRLIDADAPVLNYETLAQD